jgi:hypothetical protein
MRSGRAPSGGWARSGEAALLATPLLAALLLAALLFACSTPALTARSPEPSAQPSPAAATPEGARPPALGSGAESPALFAADLVVGSERGLEIWSTDGKLKRLVSAGPALHPRWLDSGAVVVLVPVSSDGLYQGAELQRITLADGKRTPLARLPGFSCAKAGEAPEAYAGLQTVELQDETDFELDLARGAACLRLLNRNVNMVDVWLDVQVDLASKRVHRWLVMGEDVCTPPSDVQPGNPENDEKREPGLWCESRSEGPYPMPSEGDATARPFTFTDEGTVRERTPSGGKIVLGIPGYSAELGSPSGRWLVLGGDQSDGDYIHRSLVLLDRDRGQVYPIVTGAWPEPLRAAGKARLELATPIAGTAEVVGETEVRWLGTPQAEVLIVDGVVLRPGVGSFELKGQLAR